MVKSIEQSRFNSSSASGSEVILSVNGVSKKFCRDLKRSLFYGVRDIASELSGLRTESSALRPKEFWALQDISFEVRRGEAIGLIGRNGGGKSTLLRIISGLIRPDTGSVEVSGRIAPLIALGAGFNPVLTGRENIFTNLSILGLSQEQIRDRFDDIVEFAELGDALETPVQSYSSGMAARLGFACAVFSEPDILLIDEVLSVGDILFRTKCYRRLAALREKGITFIFVSHNPQTILSMCDTAIYLKKGQLIAQGEVSSVMTHYEADLFVTKTDPSNGYLEAAPKPKDSSSGIDITAVYLRDESGRRVDSLVSGSPGYLCVNCYSYIEAEDISLDVYIKDQVGEGDWLLNLSSYRDRQLLKVTPGENELRFQMPYCGLRLGSYTAKLAVSRPPNHVYDMIEPFKFAVKTNESMSQCGFYQPRSWQSIVSLEQFAEQ